MATPALETKTIEVKSGNISLPVYVAMPEGDGPFGAVVVLQEIFGVNGHIRDVTGRIAAAGYVALAPDLYHRQAPGLETGYTPEDIQNWCRPMLTIRFLNTREQAMVFSATAGAAITPMPQRMHGKK